MIELTEKQASPGDVEAVEGMGRISDHSKENLIYGDRGVGLYRNQIRKFCRALQEGTATPQPTELGDAVINTYGSDNVVCRPAPDDETEERALLQRTNDEVIDILFAADALSGAERDEWVIEELKKL